MCSSTTGSIIITFELLAANGSDAIDMFTALNQLLDAIEANTVTLDIGVTLTVVIGSLTAEPSSEDSDEDSHEKSDCKFRARSALAYLWFY